MKDSITLTNILFGEKTFTATENDLDIIAIEKALMEIIAPKYNALTAYKIGTLLTYLGKQYYCIKDAPAGTLPTNTEFFEEKLVADIIEMIKNGIIETGHSKVADNLNPVSEESGTTQDAPFISQGTGTANNTAIVDTSPVAKQLEKQGNTIAYNQKVQNPHFTDTSNWTNSGTGTFTVSSGVAHFMASNVEDFIKSNNINGIVGHKYLFMIKAKSTTQEQSIRFGGFAGYITNNQNINTSWKNLFYIGTLNTANNGGMFIYNKSATLEEIIFTDCECIDLTQFFGGNDNIPADLLANPSHFSWYYNGSLAYDEGSLQNCNGRYLVCTGRQLWDEEVELGTLSDTTGQPTTSNNRLRSKNYTMVVPNEPLYAYNGGNGYVFVYCYDTNKNFIGYFSATNTSFNVSANCVYIKLSLTSEYGTTYKNDITISKYYSPEQGGEGYNQYYPYIAPKIYDTGAEVLRSAGSAKDIKPPSGLITRNIGVVDLGTLTWNKNTSDLGFYSGDLQSLVKLNTRNLLCVKYEAEQTATTWVVNKIGINNTGVLWVGELSISTAEAFKTAMSGVYLYYELAATTTEQGTPFPENIEINDYGMMYWLDTNGNLVSIPQGVKLFYPADYVLWLDTAHARTNGDANTIARLEDIDDAALNARGYYKLQDLSSDVTMTLSSGITVGIKKLYKIGNVCTFTIKLTNNSGSAISSLTQIMTLPSSAYPTLDLYIPSTYSQNSGVAFVGSDGSVLNVGSWANGSTMTLCVSYAT